MRTDIGVPLLTPQQKESIGQRFTDIMKRRRQESQNSDLAPQSEQDSLSKALLIKHKEVMPLIRQINASPNNDIRCIQACLLAACSTPVDLPYDCKWQASGDRVVGYIHYIEHMVKYAFHHSDDKLSDISVSLDGVDLFSESLI